MPVTRQAKSIAKIRAKWKASGRCAGCGNKSKTYRCEACNKSRREAARILMQKRRHAF